MSEYWKPDLERVRWWLLHHAAQDTWLTEVIDAHLKEDAERLETLTAAIRTLRVQLDSAEVELARLRSGLDEKNRHEAALNNTIARLRAELDVALVEDERELTELREAVKAYDGHRHRQHEWRCDTSECQYLARLRQLIEETP